MNAKTSIGDLILLSLEKAAEGYIRFEDFTYNTHKYLYGYPRPLKKSSLAQALRRLRQKGLVDFIEQDKLLLRITKRGEEKILSEKFNPKQQFKWDGMWRLVAFDIPENKREVRDLLRAKLKQWGFIRWQNSIWITQINCLVEFRSFINQVGIGRWVKVFESSNLEL